MPDKVFQWPALSFQRDAKPEGLSPAFVDALLGMTFDQLRSYCEVCRTGNVRSAARSLGRDHSSVRKQLDTLDERFRHAAHGRLVVHPTGRGGTIHITEAGLRVRTFAEAALRALDGSLTDLQRARRDRSLRIAIKVFPAYLTEFLTETHSDFALEFQRKGLRYLREFVPLRVPDLGQALIEQTDFDFALGSVLFDRQRLPQTAEGLDFIEWSREDMVLLTNTDMASREWTSELLLEHQAPLITPRGGIIYDLLVGNLDDEQRRRLNVIEWVDDGLVALDFLRLKLCDAAIICTPTVARHALAQAGAEHLRIVPFQCRQQHSVGLLSRLKDVASWAPTHPARVFRDTFEVLAARHRKAQERKTTPRRVAGLPHNPQPDRARGGRTRAARPSA